MKRALTLLCITALLFVMAGEVAAQPPLAGTTTHIVKPGETLLSIARLYGVDVTALARANHIVNPNYIYVGQRLIIPAPTTTPPTAGVYIVQAGDTLYSIARRYGTTAWAIAQANGLYNLNYIYVGQRLLIPGTVPPSPTPTPSAAGSWRGEYFNVPDLSGTPTFVRNDAALNFRWGLRSPDTRLNTDHFSVRWTRTLNFRGGVYRFKVVVDDGVRLWVDGALVLDRWQVQAETTYQVDLTLSAGNHLLRAEYFDDTGEAIFQFSFVRLGSAGQTPTPTPSTPGPTPSVLWQAEYFDNDQLRGKPAVTRVDDKIGFEWGGGAPVAGLPVDHFSVRWTRQAFFYEDNYAFCAMADDGVRLYVDGVRVMDEWHPSNALSYCTEVDMTKGNHTVVVEYYEDGGKALIYVWWERR